MNLRPARPRFVPNSQGARFRFVVCSRCSGESLSAYSHVRRPCTRCHGTGGTWQRVKGEAKV
jgi:DnaJ-class molecular chaperone